MQSIPEVSEAAEAAEVAAGSEEERTRQQSPRRTALSTSTAAGREGFATPPRGARFRSQPIERKTPQMLRNLGEHLTMCSDDELMRVHAAVSHGYSGTLVATKSQANATLQLGLYEACMGVGVVARGTRKRALCL
jgi:hypothetical protein